MAHRSSARIALLWHSENSGNLGVGALTLANIGLLRRAAVRAGRPVEFIIIGSRAEGPTYPQLADVPTLPLDRKQLVSPAGYARTIHGCDLVIDIGGGDSFSDIYGFKRLGYLLITKSIALSLRKPLVLAPQTIGPFKSAIARSAAERLIAASRVTFARDEISLGSVASSSARAKLGLTTDVAFALPFQRAQGLHDRIRVGVNVSALLYHYGYSGQNQFGLKLDYPTFVQRTLAALKARSDVELVLVPHVITPQMPIEDDLTLCRRLAAELGLAEPPHLSDPIVAKSFISGCDVLIASRMHACIAAVSTGVATIPVAYSRKFSGLFSSIGYHRTIDARHVDTDNAVATVMSLYEKRELLAREAAAASVAASEKLEGYVDTLADVIDHV